MRLGIRKVWAVAACIGLAGCGQSPTDPSKPSGEKVQTALSDAGRVSSTADGDVRVGSGALDLVRLRMDRQTSTGSSILRQYALMGQTYPIGVGETIELWAEYSGSDNPRFFVDWGDGGSDITGCGSCLLRHIYSRAGVYKVVARVDDRVSTTVTRTFNLDSSVASTFQFCNSGLITVNDNANATPYPSTIGVSGVNGKIGSVSASLRGFTHTYTSDVAVFLASPGGQGLMLMNNTGDDNEANNATLNFQDGGPAFDPTTDYGPGSFTFSAVGSTNSGFSGPFGANFTTFNGADGNGLWQLYVQDQATFDTGQFAGGWCVTITTVGSSSTGEVVKASSADTGFKLYPNANIFSYPFQKKKHR